MRTDCWDLNTSSRVMELRSPIGNDDDDDDDDDDDNYRSCHSVFRGCIVLHQ